MVHNIVSPMISRPELTLARYDVHHALPNTANTLIGNIFSSTEELFYNVIKYIFNYYRKSSSYSRVGLGTIHREVYACLWIKVFQLAE